MEKPGKELFVGFDVGSSFVHYGAVSGDGRIVFSSEPIMHFAIPIGAVKEAWRDVMARVGRDNVVNTAFTGSGAEAFPKVMSGVTYVFDSVAIPRGAEAASPQAHYVFHIGAKDSYFFELKQIGGK